ncbi:hypothetical protein CAEBREN_23079 [Caenorhabditis brenneri]|uniref:Decapping nuclease n=1 Tax=Caenorhabditis brenneri TaxID=135651 RepID=G0NTP6_CAEBE|nr:hypothetical protein CAEBREN_23079 [Caenorhabditis brenneri]
MMKTTIQVETIGYFGENGEEVERSTIPQLNDKNRKHVEKPSFSFPFLNLNVKTVATTNYKNHPALESFLRYLNNRGSLQKTTVNPNIVTDSRTLIGICSPGGDGLKIKVLWKSGVIFVWMEEERDSAGENGRYESIFRKFFTKKGTEEKKIEGVFQAKVPFGRGFWNILYSGEVEAIDVTTSAPTTFPFWKNQSEGYYWEAVFCNIPTVIVGTRTEEKEKDPKTREPLCYPELSVYKIDRLDRDSIPEKTSIQAAKPKATFYPWSIVDGENRLLELIKLINSTSEGQFYSFSRSSSSGKWMALPDEGGQEEITATPDLLPKRLNSNRRYFEGRPSVFPFLKLNIEVPDTSVGEYKLESFLNYLWQKGYPNGQKPDFVAFKQLLIYVASSGATSTIHAFKHDGVIFLTRMKNEKAPSKIDHAAVFKHFFTKTFGVEPIGEDATVRKAVLKATVEKEDGGSYSILYSGAVSAVDEDNKIFDFSVQKYGISSFRYTDGLGCYTYWKLIIGNVQSLVIGLRRRRAPIHPVTKEHIEEYFVKDIQKLNTNEYLSKFTQISRHPLNWTVSDGEKSLQDFLKMVQDTVTCNGDCFVFSKTADNPDWQIRREEEEVGEFRDVVMQNISV